MPGRQEGWKWIRPVLIAWALIIAVLPGRARASEDIVVMNHSGPSYNVTEGSDAWFLARQGVAKKFYETHGDHYDFLVVLPTFNAHLGDDADGLHVAVRNEVRGIGQPLFDNGPGFGSRARLKGYIDTRALMNGVPGSTQWEAVVLAHEVAHQWSGRAGFKETPSAPRSEALLGRNGAHWSFFLHSEASVLYGSDWEARGPGSFESVARMRRYSELDLYLMGLLSPLEVGPLTLLSPSPESWSPEALPPPDGTRISATARQLGIADIIRAEGPRLPDSSGSQKHFRAAFILLLPAGQSATPAQLAYAESLRHAFENHFFFLTRGRGIFETDLVEQPPGPVASTPGVELGLSYLLSRQSVAGHWQTRPESSLRETQQAVEVLRLFLSSAGVPASLQSAGGWLAAREPIDVDGLARLALATEGSNEPAMARLRAWLQASGSLGLSPGYRSTLLDSALVGLALTQPPAAPVSTLEVTRFLLEHQNLDGGWPALPGGPSRFEPTALVLEYLARVPQTPAITAAASQAFQYFRAHREPSGLFVDEGSRIAATGQALTSLATWRQLTPTEAFAARTALLGRQRPDGSWEGSVVDTALALRALRIVLTPNLTLTSADVQLSAAQVTEGETVLATVRILNTGYAEARNVLIQAFDSFTRPLGSPVLVESIEAGGSAQRLLSLDTRQSGGSTQVFIVADPEGTLDEGKESDNRAAVALFVSEAPATPDLFVQAGSVTVTPSAVDRLPAQAVVNARVGNLGKADAPPVDVVIRMGTQVLATAQLSLGAQSSQLVSRTVQIAALQASGVITVDVDPGDEVQEPVETNNSGTAKLGLTPGVDLRVTGVTAPATVNQGQDITLQYELANGGTTEAMSTGTLEILSGGTTVATRPLASQILAAGGHATGQILWRANVAGTLRAVVRVQHPEDLDPSNDTGSASFEVQPSSLPNLMVVTGSLSITPEPPRETQTATVGVTVRNGGQSAAQGFTVDLYLGEPGAGGTRFHREQVSGLAVGATLQLTGTLTLPREAPERISVVLDDAQAITEFDEEDNQSFLVIAPVPIADLVVSAADIRPTPAFPRENTTVPVTVSVLNAGGQRAEGIPVELLRVGSSGSEELIGQTIIPAIEPGQRGESLITWSTTGLRGPQRLIAIVNRAQTVPEQRESNNRAERQVSVQDAALALSEPWFSPNGDGLRDVTEISYRLATEAPVEALIEDGQGRRVRVLTAPAATDSSLSWDGRSAEGRIVPDGSYSIHVRTLAPTPGTHLGTLTAVVDTNRSPLDGSELSSLEVESLQGTASTSIAAVAMPDENGVVLSGKENGSGRCGLYHQPLGGAPARRLTPDGWPCSDPDGLAISPDAGRIALHRHRSCSPGNRSCRDLEILSVVDQSLLRVATDEAPSVSVALTGLPPVFSRDGSRLYFVVTDPSSSGFLIEEIRVDGTQRRTLTLSNSKPIELSLSPEGDRLAVVDRSGAIFFIELPHGRRQEFLPAGTISGFQKGGFLNQVESSLDFRHGWLPSGAGLAWSSPGIFVRDPGGEGYLPLAPRLELQDGKEGGPRELFAGTPYGMDFAQDRAAVAVHPVSGGTAFRYTPLLSTEPQLWTVSTAGNARMLLPNDVRALRWSPSGSFLFGFTKIGGTDHMGAVTTRDNLFVRLSVTRTPGAAGMTFQGTATDLNFEEWQLGVRAYGASVPFVAVAASTLPVHNGLLTEWIPPGPGMYEAQLLARDRAGNVRARTVMFGYSLSPAVANVSRSPEFFSPNGDGVLDTVELRYTITRPTVADFQILDAHNQVVRQQALPHPDTETRDFALLWDGLDSNGIPVPDGEYTLSIDGTRLSVVVDNTPPVAELSLSETGGSGLPAPYRLEDHYVLPVGRELPPTDPERVRIVAAETTWKIQDANLKDWAFEVASPQDPSVSRPLFTGTQPVFQARPIAIESLRGSFRLRATDRAGNQALTLPLQLDDQLFVTLAGLPWSERNGYWPLPSQAMPRLTGYFLAEMEPLRSGLAVISYPSTFLDDGYYAFALNTTSGSRLGSFSIAYRPEEGGEDWIVDTQNVQALGDSMVLWNATGAGKVFELEIRALDENQKLFRAPVLLHPIEGPRPPMVPPFACVKTRGGEATVLSAFVKDDTFLPEHLAPGARWSFKAKASGQTTDFPAAPVFDPENGGTALKQTLSTAALTECEYNVEFVGTDLRDQAAVRDEGTVNLCKPQVTSGRNGISLSESLREGIRSAEVFVAHQGREVVVARFGAFEGTSPIHPIDRSLFPDAPRHTLRARITLMSGARVVTEPNLGTDDFNLLDPGCNDEDMLETPRGLLALSPPLRDADAALCGIHSPILEALLTGKGAEGQLLEGMTVEIASTQGQVIAQPEVSGVTLGTAVVDALVRIPTQSLPEGAHWLRATATWSDGTTTSAKAQPVFIDRTAAHTVVTRPAATGRVCPESRRGSNGAIERYLVVEGTVADRHLESYELLIREPGGVPERASQVDFDPSIPSSVQGVLGTIDVARWGSDFELLLSARDVSGSSWCAAPVFVEVATPPSVGALSVSPGLFSPDADGNLDTTNIQFTVDQDVTVTLSVEAAGGQTHTIFQGPLTKGSQSLPWNGLLAGGTPLADGAYPLRVRATGACGMTGEASTLIRLDATDPVARIDFPTESQVLGASFSVTGQATDEHLLRYELSLGQGASPTHYTPISSASAAASGVLGAVSLENLPTGAYTLRLVVEDQAGNSQQTLRRFQHQPGALLQATAVVPSLISPDDDGVLDTTHLSVKLSAPASVSVTLLDGSGQPMRVLVEPTSLPAGTSELLLAGPALGGLSTGVHSLLVSADSGSTAEAASASLEIDLLAPHAELSSPSSGAVAGADLTVEGLIEDHNLESWTLTHVVPGSSTGQMIANGSATTSGILAVRSGLAEGTHQLVLEARDRAGHAHEHSVSFTVDATPPLVSFLSPSGGTILSGRGGPVAIRGQAEDAHLHSVRLEATTFTGTETLFSGPSLPPGGLLHDWTFGYEADGPAELRLVAEDAAGNTAESLISLELDSTPPAVALVEPRGSTHGKELAFRGSATDARLSTWELELGRGTPGSADGFQKIASASEPVSSGVLTILASVGDGDYVARLRARDSAGNESLDEAAFTVDSIAPLPVPVLSATVERPNTAALTWEASPSNDVTEYEVFRATGSGSAVLIATVGAEARSYVDASLPDGRFRYSVVARDASGNTSNPSPEAQVEIDATPPIAQWLAPTPAEQVRGELELLGTAHSQSDFREYRVSIGAGSAPTAFTLLTRASLPVSAGRLGELDARSLPQGSIQTLRLEAEDLIGNVREALVTFTVDNLPPAAPVLTHATASGTSVSLTWEATPEEDVLGFVPFRDGAPLGNPGNASPRDLRPYALPSTSRSYTDTLVPDGSHSYHLVAIDRAGNVSGPSNTRQVTLETRAPIARIAEPAALERLRHDARVVAQSDDQDIVSVGFEVRSVPSASFTALGAPATHAPFHALLPLSQFSSRVVELRAVARDSANKIDPSPASIHVLKEEVPSQPSMTALVDGDVVQFSWTDTNPAGLLAGFELSDEWGPVTHAPERWPGTASATSSASGSSPANGYDATGGSTAWTPGAGLPQAWTLALEEPILLRGLDLLMKASTRLRLEARIDGFWVMLSPEVEGLRLAHSLDTPLEVEAIRVTLLSASNGTSGLADVTLDALPLEHGTSSVVSAVSTGLYTYRLRSMGFGGTPSEPAEVSVAIYAPLLEAAVALTPESTVLLQGSEVPPSAEVTLFHESDVIATTTADPQGRFALSAPLVPGPNAFYVRATDGAGNRSLPSEIVTVEHIPAPSAALTLSPGGVTHSDVSLNLTVEGELADIAGFVLVREDSEGTVELPPSPAVARSFIDRGVRNGSYTYRAHAFNENGFRGAASNGVTVTVDIAPPAAPVEVAVEPLPSGGALAVSWAPGDARTVAYRVERAIGAGGPFEVLAGFERVITTGIHDLRLSANTLYRYRILGFDALGNISSPSAIASGVPVDSTPPAPPRLTSPTVAGKPVTVSTPTVTLSGLTDPGTQVTLFRNGVAHAEASSGALSAWLFPVELSQPPTGPGWPSADGQRVAYVVQSGTTGIQAVTVESRLGELLGTFSHPSFHTIGEVTFSPDGQRVAIQASSSATSKPTVYIADLDTGEVRRPTSSSSGAETSATWAPNSRELAWQVTPSGAPSAVIVVDTETESEQWLTGEAGAPLMSPRHAATGSTLFALAKHGADMQLLRIDPASGSSTPLFEASSIEPDYAVSPDSGRIALVATREGQRDLYSVSVSTGASVRLTHDAKVERLPAFSLDGQSLAFQTHGFLVIHEGGQEQRFSGPSASRLSWSQTGELLTPQTLGLARLDWGARFEFTGVRLESTETSFSATATDAAQRTSLPAAPIQITLNATHLPDLVAEVQIQPAAPRMGHPFDAFVTVRNQGGGAAPATTVSVAVLSLEGESITVSPISLPALPAGGMSTAVIPFSDPDLHGPRILEVIADPEQRVDDPIRDNNRVRHPFSVAVGDHPVVAISTSPETVTVDGESLATITVSNPGGPRNVDVEVHLITPDGTSVFQVGGIEHLAPLGAGQSITFTRQVEVGRTLAGAYQVKAVVREGTEVLSEAKTPLSIQADRTTHLRLAASRARYIPGEAIALTATVRNDSTNSFLEDASYLLTVTGPMNASVLAATTALPRLTQGSVHPVLTEVSSLALPPGQYEAKGIIQLGSRQLAIASAHFAIEGLPLVTGAISVLGQGAPPAVKSGQPLTVDFDVANQGTAVEPSLALRVAIVDGETNETLASHALPARPIEVGDSISGQHEFSTAGLPLKSYAAYLLAERPGGPIQVLASASFHIVDGQGPVIQPLNLTDGMFLLNHLTPEARVIDPAGVTSVTAHIVDSSWEMDFHPASGPETDGVWSAMDLLHPQGVAPIVFVFVATDTWGNTSELSLTVFFDHEPPEITVTGVTNGALLKTPAIPLVEVQDEHLATVSILLDGEPFISGTAVSTDGPHELQIRATDRAGRESLETLRFTVDMTAPTVSVSGVTEGGVFRQNVMPVVTIRDRDLKESSITLDGQPFVPGVIVTAEGNHTLHAQAADRAGNQTVRQLTFTVDQTPPTVEISGVSHGSQYAGSVTPVISIQDAHLATSEVRLNGLPFVSGTPVTQDGAYTLTVRAEDLAGWVTERNLLFSVQSDLVEITPVASASFSRVLALVRAGTCTASASEVQRVQAFLEAELGGPERLLTVMTEEATFLESLRSGVANVVIVFSLGGTGKECSEALTSLEPDPADSEAVKLRKAWSRELTEQVFSGHAGLVVVRSRSEDMPLLREVLGVDFSGTFRQSQVQLPPSALGGPAWLSAPAGGVILQARTPTVQPAAVYSENSAKLAGALHSLGQGRSVTFGVDLTGVLPASQAALALRQSVAYVLPAPSQPTPLGVTAVELRMKSPARDARLRVVETLPSALTALWASSEGTIAPGGHGITWEPSLVGGVTRGLRVLVRLPELPGSHAVSTSVTSLRGKAPRGLGTRDLELAQPVGSTELVARVRQALEPLEDADPSAVSEIEAWLEVVQARPIQQRGDIEATLDDLFAAIEATRSLQGEATQVRKALGDLIRYWEARWYLL